MEKIVLNSRETSIFQKIVRLGLILIGIFLWVWVQYLVEGRLVYLFKIIGVLIFIPAAINPFSIFGGNDKMVLTDEFVKVTDEMTLTRTAYWNKIYKAVLTRFSLRIYYNSGAGENFRIPYLQQEEYEKLRSKIIQKSEEHNFAIEETQWWNIF